MSHTLASSSLLTLALLSACGGNSASKGGLVLDFAFEDSCQPTAVSDMTVEAPKSSLAFDQGVEGRAARFDGSGAEIKMRGLDRLGVKSAMTLEFFMNAADWENPYRAGSGLESMVSHSDIFTVGIAPHSWKLEALVTTTACKDSVRLSGGTIRPGTWHHVALVIDGVAGKSRLVLDGEVVGEIAVQGDVAINPKLALDVGTWFKQNQAFCGELDSIHLWNRALSADELRARAALIAKPRTSNG